MCVLSPHSDVSVTTNLVISTGNEKKKSQKVADDGLLKTPKFGKGVS
jgi:hypothetical protein